MQIPYNSLAVGMCIVTGARFGIRTSGAMTVGKESDLGSLYDSCSVRIANQEATIPKNTLPREPLGINTTCEPCSNQF